MATNKSTSELKWKKLRDGVASVLPTGGALSIEGQTYTQAQMLAKIDSVLALYAATATAKAQAAVAIATEKAAKPANQQWYVGFVAVLKQTLGSKSLQLGQFGLAVKTNATPQTATAKALSAAKAAKTKAARHILGKKQRAAIPAVTGVSLQVVEAPGPTLPAAAPVGSATPPVVGAAPSGQTPATPSPAK